MRLDKAIQGKSMHKEKMKPRQNLEVYQYLNKDSRKNSKGEFERLMRKKENQEHFSLKPIGSTITLHEE